MKNFVSLFFLFIVLSCNDSIESYDKVPEPSSEGLQVVNARIVLPEGTPYDVEDLEVSTLITDKAKISDDGTYVETFEGYGMELVLATNSSDNIVLLGYINPGISNNIILNAETTAIALVMLHPWTIDLSVSDKAAAITDIKKFPAFATYLSSVETMIASGDVNPLGSEIIISELVKVHESINSKISQIKDPLLFDVDGNIAKVTNKESSAVYGVGLYSAGDYFGDKTVEAYNSDKNTVSFNLPSDGKWELRAKNGLAFDGSQEDYIGRRTNGHNLVLDLIGIISSGYKESVKKLKCIGAIGNFLFGVGESSVGFVAFKKFKKTKNPLDLFKPIGSFVFGNITGFNEQIAACATPGSGYKKFDFGSKFRLISKIFEKIGIIENGWKTSKQVYALVKYDNEVNFCFVKNKEDISFCNGMILTALEGKLNFGKISTKANKSLRLTISNNIEDGKVIEIIGFEFPDDSVFETNWGPRNYINPNDNEVVEIFFKPEVEGVYSGKLIVKNDADQENNEIEIIAEAVDALYLDDALDFEVVALKNEVTQMLTMRNDTDEDIDVSLEIPNGFTVSWNDGIIKPKETIIIEVTFKPEMVQNYNSDIIVNSSLELENNKIKLFASGIKGLEFSTKNIDFEDVIKDDVVTKEITVYNPSEVLISVNSINLPNGYTISPNNFELDVTKLEQVLTISFKPDETGPFNGDITLNNDFDQVNNKVSVKGNGISEINSIDGIWYGETNVTKCEPTRFDTVTPNCEMHSVLNERDVEFIGDTTLSCSTGFQCGLVIFGFYTGTETVLKNKFEFDGTTLIIEMITMSSGSYFSGRTYNYTGVINESGDRIEGNYTMDMPGGIWGAYTEGSMTFTKK